MSSTDRDVVDRWPCVGRDAELLAFSRILANPRNGCVVIRGPQGVGKSRFAEECWERAVRRGFTGGRAAATVAARSTPLGAVAYLLTPHGDFGQERVDTGPVPPVRPAARGAEGRLLLIDDIQWLDPASGALLHRLMDTGATRLVVTVRSGIPHPPWLNALVARADAARIELGLFDEPQVQRILEAALDGLVHWRCGQTLHAASGGNVLYLRELVKGGVLAGALRQDGGVWKLRGDGLNLTPFLTDLVVNRLRQAGAEAETVLRLMAFCDVLPVRDAREVALPGILAELESAGLIRKLRRGQRTALTLTHPLYGEVLRTSTPPLKRRDIVLDQIERTWAHGARRAEDIVSIASWKLAATGTVEPGLLSRSAALAGSFHDYRRMLRLLKAIPREQRSAETDRLHGGALHALGRCADAEELYREALSRTRLPEERIPLVMARTQNAAWGLGQPEEALDAVTAEIVVHGAADRTALEELRGCLLISAGETADGLALLAGPGDDAGGVRRTNVRLASALAGTLGLATLGRSEEAEIQGKAAFAAHCDAIDSGAMVDLPATMQLTAVMYAHMEAGRLVEARSLGERIVPKEPVPKALAPAVWGTFLLGRLEWLAGNPRIARRWFTESVALARGTQLSGAMGLALAGLGAAAAVLGDVAAADEALAESRRFPILGAFRGEERLCEAWLLAWGGQLTQAREVLAEGAEAARQAGHTGSEAMLLTDLARLGAARQVADRLAGLAQRTDGPFNAARARLAAGLAAGDAAELVAVAEDLRDIGAHLLEAEAAAAAAAAWRRCGQGGRAAAAAAAAESAARRSDGGRSTRMAVTRFLAELTTREQEIALQAATGRSSKEIAATLGLSVRTVDNTLQRIFGKFGINNRRKLAELLHRDATSASHAPARPGTSAVRALTDHGGRGERAGEVLAVGNAEL
jgi:DNA-binding CsgD family transcriptional regulator